MNKAERKLILGKLSELVCAIGSIHNMRDHDRLMDKARSMIDYVKHDADLSRSLLMSEVHDRHAGG